MKNVYKYIESLNINKNDSIVCAISGGPDSMCLLDILVKLKVKHKFNIICAHVNHNLRIESNDEEVFVKNYCERNGVIFEYMKITEYQDDNFHNCARNIRYEFFEKLINKYQSKYLFTAHHGDDLMETVLMRIVRGSTLKGYGGFSIISNKKNYQVVRPLITVTKQQILDYNEQNNIKFAIDQSNFKDVYTRNRYRKYILPRLKDENKNVHLKFYSFSEYMLEAGEYFTKTAHNICEKIYINNKLNIANFKQYDHIIQIHIIYYILELNYQDEIYLVNRKHVDNIIELIYNNSVNGYISLPNKKIIKEYNYLIIDDIKNIEPLNIILKDIVKLPNGKTIEIVKNSNLTDNNVIYLNSEDIHLPLFIRYRKNGDKIKIKNMDNYKKINDIFINEKIPKQNRDTWPIVCDSNNEIIWLPGLKKSHFDSQNSGKYDIILKYY